MKRFRFCFLACSILILAAQSVRAETTALAVSAKPAKNEFAGQVMANGKIGRVGIGTAEPVATLDVYQGEVKISSSGAVCTREIEGALRYADARLQLCDGTGWRNVSLDKAQ